MKLKYYKIFFINITEFFFNIKNLKVLPRFVLKAYQSTKAVPGA